MNRITKSMVNARIDSVNTLLGFDPENLPYSTVGSVVLDSAYGGYRVDRYCNESGGVSALTHGYGTLREAYIFLNGMITALRD